MSGRFSFGSLATTNRGRSRFDLSSSVKTSFNAGDLIPLKCWFIKPGDIFKVSSEHVVRVTSSFLKPVMDNAFMDVWYFWVPYRLVWKDWENFITGGTSPSAYSSPFEGKIPSFRGSGISFPSGTVGDYFGFSSVVQSTSSGDTGISVLPFRAYGLVYEQWFRNQNVIDETLIQTGSWQNSEIPNSNAASPSNYVGKPFKVSKLNDYFTACLPAPQKGVAVDVPVVGGSSKLPVYPNNGSLISQVSYPVTFGVVGSYENPTTSPQFFVPGVRYDAGSSDAAQDTLKLSANSGELSLYPNNLYALLDQVQSVSVSDLRFAFQYQKLLERSARAGSRYTEYLQAGFGVSPKDATLQRSEFLGGRRIPLNVQQVSQTSQPTTDSPLANVAAFSLSNGSSRFTKGFDEHGVVLCLGCIRQYHTYQQGINRNWLVSTRQQEYDPVFANISEQPVYSRELFAGAPVSDIFGYNEAYAYLRYEPNMVTGQMRSGITNTLDIWHFADFYENAPVISKQFNEETSQFIDRTLSVSSEKQDQFIVDNYFNVSAYRVLPTYGTPGLIDHH